MRKQLTTKGTKIKNNKSRLICFRVFRVFRGKK